MIGRLASWALGKLWQEGIGPAYNKRKNIICRFHPSCSEYARLAFLRHGFFRGLALSSARVKACRPDNSNSVVNWP